MRLSTTITGLMTALMTALMTVVVLPSASAATAAASSPGTVSVPDTAYPVPDGAVFLSTTGSDGGTGSSAAPFRTLGRALGAVAGGGTIVVREGTYHDGVATSTSKRFTLQPYPHEQVWFDGADQVSGWAQHGTGVWSRTGWSTPAFCGGHYYDLPYGQQSSANTGPCTHRDMAKDPAHPAAGDPQMLFVDGVPIPEVSSLAQVAGNFYYDQATRTVHLGVDPAGHRVEMSSRASALVLQGGAGATVRGVGFKRYATNEFPGNTTHGAVLAGEPNVVFEQDVFAFQAGAGLSITDPRSAVVRDSVFYRNGFNGLDANGHQHSSGAVDGFSLMSSTFEGNNTELFGAGCSLSCASAGSKLAHMDGFTVKGNTFKDTAGNGKGLWCDLACSNGVIVDNTFTGNGDTGLYYEVSNTGLIASNLITGNRAYGLKVGSANTRVYNNTLAGNGSTAVLVYDDNRSYGVGGWTDVGPDTAGVVLRNNVVSSGSVSLWRTSSTAPNTGPNTFLTGMDHDAFHRAGPGTLVEWRDGGTTTYAGTASLTAARGLEVHGQDVVGGADPFFVNADGGDYRIRSTSAAHGSGAPLPADVAAAIGVPAGQPVDRGALVYPGRGMTTNEQVSSPTAPTPAAPTPSPGGSPTAAPVPDGGAASAPADGTTISGTTALTLHAAGATSARLYLGASLASTYTGPGPYRFGVNTRRLTNGTRVHVTWQVTGTSGTRTLESHLTVQNTGTDTTAPTITSASPGDGAALTGRVRLRASATDDVAVTSARLYLGSSLAHTFTGPGPYSFEFDSPRVDNGTRVRMTWKVSDAAGNTWSTQQYGTVQN